MSKPWPEPLKRKQPKPDPMAMVRVRFVKDCTHCHLPFAAGDEIMVESHWADSIEAIGSGHRVPDNHKES